MVWSFFRVQVAVGFALLVGGVFLASSAASAQSKVGVLCATANGSVSVRKSCPAGQTKLTLAALSSRAPAGSTGATGPTGVSGYEIVSTVFSGVAIPTDGVEFLQACPAGKTTIGGGCYSTNGRALNYRSYPFDSDPREWRCGYVSRSPFVGENASITVYAVCVDE